MKKFKELVDEVNYAAVQADKFYVADNMQAARRLFASLMTIDKKCKIAREELSAARKIVRERRQNNGQQ